MNFTTIHTKSLITGIKQTKARLRKNYSKENFLNELDKRNWTMSTNGSERPGKRKKNLEKFVEKYTKNITESLESIAPIKTINIRTGTDKWKGSSEIKDQLEIERKKWTDWKENPGDEKNKTGRQKDNRPAD